MLNYPLLALLLASVSDFAGSWNIRVVGQPETRAWWLKVAGDGGGTSKFVGASGGRVDELNDITLKDGEIRFTIKNRWRGLDAPPAVAVFTARLVRGKLVGVFSLDGKPELSWTGERAPVIRDMDDGTWREGNPVALFNGKDLTGWIARHHPVVFVPPPKVYPGLVERRSGNGWTVKDGILSTDGHAVHLVTTEGFWNFALHLEFRILSGGSGVGLRGRYEVQIQDDFGKSISPTTNGSVYGRIAPSVNASRPPGEWQSLDIRFVGRDVTLVLNGTKVIDRQKIEGLTAMATDPDETAPGPIVLQGNHGPVDFRNIIITQLWK